MTENPITPQEPGTCLLVLSADLDLGALIGQADHKGAAAAFRKAIAINPNHTRAL